ncbi:MAG: acyltransferase [Erythrobacter sp.]|nr:acyltransferase [Erythrobacter sp.]NCQ63667.1 acyltransferase [Alphaproteobacteria bacterium]
MASQGAPASSLNPHRQRFVALDSWRGIAAIMVMMHHMPREGFVATSPLVRESWLFVEFFFVLSGFVIASAYFRKLAEGYPLAHFMALRLGRLFPAHAVVLILFVPVFVLFALGGASPTGSTGKSWLDLVRTLFFVQIFNDPPVSNWNDPSWSIAAEFWIYGLAALGIAAFKRWVFLLALLAGIVSFVPLWIYGPMPFDFLPGIAVARGLFGFAVGMIVWRIGGRRTAPSPGTRRGLFTIAEVLALVATGGLMVAFGDSLMSTTLPVFFGAAIWLFSLERGAVSALLRRRAFVMIGELSYAIYIGHMLVILGYYLVMSAGNAFLPGGAPDLPGDIVTLSLATLAIAFAWSLHRWIEKPARDWTYRVVGIRDTARAEAIAPTF